jgi:hypothetical protein
MRFFSNESKETNDDQQADDQHPDVPARAAQENPDQAHDEHPERVQSDPVSVPSQRAGSPWSSTPDTGDEADAELAGRERADQTAEDRPADAPPFHEPGPQPTAFGASTVGGAVAASAVANPRNDTWEATDRQSAADDGVGDDRSVVPGDGASRDDTGHDTGHATGHDDTVALPTAGSHRVGPDDAVEVVDIPLDDRGTFDDPRVDGEERPAEDTTPPDTSLAGATGSAVAADDTSATARADEALKDDGGFADPKVVDPATGQALDSGDAAGSDSRDALDSDSRDALDSDSRDAPDSDSRDVPESDSRDVPGSGDAPADAVLKDDGSFDDPQVVGAADEPAAEAEPAAAKPGSVAEPVVAALFAGADAQTFRDRWRDVQLRFVDSPKEATAEAAGLVDEAADKLAAALKEQKAKLGGDHEDTEKLRVELRGYREMLNRILDL